MPRNPKAYRLCKDTGTYEYDDSMPNIEGKCPRCGTIHTCSTLYCLDCISRERDEQERIDAKYAEYLADEALEIAQFFNP